VHTRGNIVRTLGQESREQLEKSREGHVAATLPLSFGTLTSSHLGITLERAHPKTWVADWAR